MYFILIMNRKGEGQNGEDPYQLIRRLRSTIQVHRQTIEEYKLLCDSLLAQKNAALVETARLRRENQHFIKKLERHAHERPHITQHELGKQREWKSMQLGVNSPTRELSGSNLTLLGTPSQIVRKKQGMTKEFVPHQVQFGKRKQTARQAASGNDAASDSAQEDVGKCLVEDFLVIAPDTLELRRLREVAPEEKELRIQQFTRFNFSKHYATHKDDYLKDVASRCFPFGAPAWRETVDSLDDLKRQLQVGPEQLPEAFILNLKGDFSQPPLSDHVFLGGCNPFRALFAVCLRVPDFIPIKDEKHYQRSQQQVWRVQKIYAILTYYPFLSLHIALLTRIHSLLQPPFHILPNHELLARNLTRNLADAQKDESLARLLTYCMGRQPQLGQVWIYQKHYLGTVPTMGRAAEYNLARFACGVFFSVLAYEEALLLLAALFLEKTIIFVGRNEAAASLCALFLVSCISPFTYSHHLILNCTAEMVENIVFGFPLPLVASLKKEGAHFPGVLANFIDNTLNHFRGFQGSSEHSPLILVDLDSNCIFYDHQLGKLLERAIVQPSAAFRQAYLSVNPAHSKSFSFPKKMPVELLSRPRNDYEKNAEQKKKLLKQYQQKIDNNTSKWPTFRSSPAHIRLLDLLAEYLHSFAVPPDVLLDLLRAPKETRQQEGKQILLRNHPEKPHLVEAIANSQIFADYLDQLEKTFPMHFYR